MKRIIFFPSLLFLLVLLPSLNSVPPEVDPLNPDCFPPGICKREITRGPNWVETSVGNVHSREIYSYNVNMPDSTGEYVPFENVTTFSEKGVGGGKYLELKWTDSKGVAKRVVLDPYVVINGQELTNVPASIDMTSGITTNIGQFKWEHGFVQNPKFEVFGYYVNDFDVDCTAVGFELRCGEQIISFNDIYDSYSTSLNTTVMNSSTFMINVTKNKVWITKEDIVYLDPTVELNHSNVTADTYIRKNNKDKNAGSFNLMVTEASTYYFFVLIKFDISGIPEGSIIGNANLSLYGDSTSSAAKGNISIYELLHDWKEGTGGSFTTNTADVNGTSYYERYYQDNNNNGNSPFNNLDADWACNMASHHGLCPWNGTDGDINSTAEDNQLNVGNIDDIWINWTITNVVDRWINDASNHPNYGVYLNQTKGSNKYWRTKEHATATTRPKLTIIYTADTTGPAVLMESPANLTINKTNTKIKFFYNVSDAGSVDNCTLYLTNSTTTLSNTSTSITEDTAHQFLSYQLPNYKNYNWTINCTDNANNLGTNNTYWEIRVDNSVAPTIVSTTANNTKPGLNEQIYFFSKITDPNIWAGNTISWANFTIRAPNGTYFISAALGNSNGTTNATSGWWNYALVNMSADGTWNWTLNVSDSDGKTRNASGSIGVADVVAPYFVNFTPTNKTYYNNATIPLRIKTYDDKVLNSCWYILSGDGGATNNSNVSVTCNVNTTIKTLNGSNTLWYWADDTFSNSNNTIMYFESMADVIPPVVIIQSPTASQIFSSRTNIPLNYTVSDNQSISSCFYNVTLSTGTSHLADNFIDNSSMNLTFDVSLDADYRVNVWCNDSSNNKVKASALFSVDTSTPPGAAGSPGGGTPMDKRPCIINGEPCLTNSSCCSGICWVGKCSTKYEMMVCNFNGICELGENKWDCKSDCNLLDKENLLSSKMLFYLLLLTLFCGFMAMFWDRRKKKK